MPAEVALGDTTGDVLKFSYTQGTPSPQPLPFGPVRVILGWWLQAVWRIPERLRKGVSWTRFLAQYTRAGHCVQSVPKDSVP